MKNSASFSSCGFYRWWLSRNCGKTKKTLIFIGLNPSEADASREDQTLRKLICFAHSWGFGSLVVLNLFARISKAPSLLKKCEDPIGKNNNLILCYVANQWTNNPLFELMLGWGIGGNLLKRDRQIMKFLRIYFSRRARNLPSSYGPMAIGLTRSGCPRHPLYAPKTNLLKEINWLEEKDGRFTSFLR